MEEDVRKAHDTLMDDQLPVWSRIKVADKLKALGQFDDEAVGAMKKIWHESDDFNEMAGALKGLEGFIDVGFREEIVTALQEEFDEGNPAPKFRAIAVESLATMTDDPEAAEWVNFIATSDPEPRVQAHASKFLTPAPAAPPKDTAPTGR